MQQEYVGVNSVQNLEGVLSRHNPNSIFLVTGGASYELSGAKSAVEPLLSGFRITRFSDFEVNPKLTDIERGIDIFREADCDLVIAIGGGSVMDVAKSINVLAANDGKPEDYINKKATIENRGKVLVGIPTTSGSGSEATKFAVIYIDKTKYSLEHELVLPDYAIVDPQLTVSLPKGITASTGMDALSQAVESYWCVNSNDESKDYAREAIKLVMGNLSDAVNNPSEVSREAMARAAHLAGKAINISKTTASHAISYPITSYFSIPHGHAVALTVGQMLVYNSGVSEQDVLDQRGVEYVKNIIDEITALLGAEDPQEASKIIADLMDEIGLATKLREVGIKAQEDIDIIVRNGFNPDRVKNNPRELTEEALRVILEGIR